MSGFLWVALWILLLTGAGTTLTWGIGREAGLAPSTRVAAGWLAGQLALGAVATGLSWAGLSWTPMRLLLGVFVLMLPGAVWAWRRRSAPGSPLPGWNRIDLVAVIVLVLGALSVMVGQVRTPLWSNDAIAIWALKARVFAAEQGIRTETLADDGFDFSHPEYPVLWPVTLAAPMAGERFDDHGVTLFAPFLTLLLLAGLIGELRRKGLRFAWAAALGLIFLSFASLLGPFHVGLAELPLTVALLVAVLALLRLRTDGSPAAAWLVALGLSAAVLLKNEGIAMLAAAGVVALWPGRRHGLRQAFTALLPPVLVAAASMTARRIAGLGLHGDADIRWIDPAELTTRLIEVVSYAAQELVWQHVIVTIALLALLVLGHRAGARFGALAGFLALAALAYLPAYLWTSRDLTWHLETTLTRIAAPFGILFLLLVGGHLARWLDAPVDGSA